jgi:hypothetical protein
MSIRLVSLICLFFIISGCGGVELPELYKFSGSATFNGKPVTNATVVFISTKGGRPSYGNLDAAGKFEMNYSPQAKGVSSGENKISLTPNTPGPTDPPLSKELQEFFESYSEVNSKMILDVNKDEVDYNLVFK